jgi:hypothetical protein
MNYHGLVKRLDLPAGWIPPAKLEYDDIRARAISRADNDDDVQGINASIELIRRTRGGNWPTGPVSTSDAATCTRWDGGPPSAKNCSRTTST